MALIKEEMIEQCVKAIKDNNLMFIEEVISLVPFSKQTFYNHNLDKVDDIKDLLDHNKIATKVGLKKKWYQSDQPTLQIALYKLIGTDDEYKRLANAKQEVENTNKNHHTVEYQNVSKDPKFKEG